MTTRTASINITTTVTECPLCYSTRTNFFGALQNECTYVVCLDCGFIYQNPRPSAEDIGEWYKGKGYLLSVYKDFGITEGKMRIELDRAHRTLDYLRPHFIGGIQEFIDIGPGVGIFPELVQNETKCKTTLVEPNLLHSKLLAIRMPEAKIVDDIAQLDGKDNFNLVTILHTLEHIYQPVDFLKAVRKFTYPGSLVFISVPNVEWHIAFEIAHMNCFTERTLRAMLEAGVYLPPSGYEAWFLSTEHGDAEIERTAEAAASAASGLK